MLPYIKKIVNSHKRMETIIYILQNNFARYICLKLIIVFRIRYLFVRIDTNHTCNIKCKTCYFSSTKEPIKGDMGIDRFKKIADNIFPLVRVLQFGCYAEPLCSNQFGQYLSITKERKIPHIYITSNGQLLNDKSISEIVSNNVDEINISICGGTERTYEFIQTGASWERLWSNLDRLNQCKKQMNSVKPRITINFVLNKLSINEAVDIIPLFKKHNIFHIHLRQLIEFRGMDNDFYYKMKLDKTDIEKIDDIINQYTLSGFSISKSRQCFPTKKHSFNKAGFQVCLQPYFQIFINPDSKIKFCLFHDWGHNLVNNSLKSILKQKDVSLFFSNLIKDSPLSCWRFCPFFKEAE
jgi:MoaA/NifB/PqqE/SkfB family radical SAM enzyme